MTRGGNNVDMNTPPWFPKALAVLGLTGLVAPTLLTSSGDVRASMYLVSFFVLAWSLSYLSDVPVQRVYALGGAAAASVAITLVVFVASGGLYGLGLLFIVLSAALVLTAYAALASRFGWPVKLVVPVLALAFGLVGFHPYAREELLLLMTVVAGILVPLYFVPTWVARHRQSQNFTPIFLINVFAGFTLIGWVGALAWAAMPQEPRAETHPPTAASTNAVEAMRQLVGLRDAGLVSPEEFELKRGELLQRI